MEQKLKIQAINLLNYFKRNDSGRELPEHLTLERFDGKTLEDNLEKIFKILKECDKNGFFINKDLENILIPGFSSGKHGEFFEVKMILYGCSDWNRFERYTVKEGTSREESVDFDKYVMSFNHFNSLGRPREIFIDYHKAISLEEN